MGGANPGPPSHRESRAIVVAALCVAGAIGVVAAAVPGLRSLGDALTRGSCTTTKAVVTQTVSELERRFDLAELNYACQSNLAAVVSDQAYLSVSAAADYASRSALLSAIRGELVRAGWRDGAGSRRLMLRRGGSRYEAAPTANSIAPALAIVRVRNTDPARDHGVDIDDPIPEKHFSDAQRLPYVTVPAFVPRFVPPGHTAWAPPSIVDLDDTESELSGGGRVAPALRSTAPPKGFSLRDCDLFTARSKGDRCRLFGTTRSGLRVYVARDDSEADGLAVNAVAIVRGAVVTLLYAHNHPYVRPRLSRASVLRIFDSLRARNTPARR